MHWITNYIGLPWVNGDSDCYQLVRKVYQDRLSVSLPGVPIDASNVSSVVHAFANSDALSVWRPILQPQHMCMVFMGRHRSSHCGVWLNIDGGGVLSSYQDSGAVFESMFKVKQRQFNHFEFYKYEG